MQNLARVGRLAKVGTLGEGEQKLDSSVEAGSEHSVVQIKSIHSAD